jgi:hypothetical protein
MRRRYHLAQVNIARALAPIDHPQLAGFVAELDEINALADGYGSAHTLVMRQRRKWFERFRGAYTALWWIDAGHIPSVLEAKERLEHFETHGATPHSFSFATLFPAPAAASPTPIEGFADPCPVS